MRRACALLVVAALASLEARAQTELWCGEHAYDPAHPLAWEVLAPTAEPLIDELELAEAYQIITRRFEDRVEFLPESDVNVAALRDALFFYQQLVTVVGREAPQVWREIPIPGTGMLSYDLGGITPNDPEDDRRVTVPCAAFEPGRGDSVARSVGYLARSMLEAGEARDLSALRRGGAAVATRTYQSYEDLLYEGLPMWPWELKVNELFVPDEFEERAPDRQLTVMRPNVSLGLLFDGDEASEADYALTLEPIGFVKYTSDDYSTWWGASLLVAMTDDNGKGYGAMFRWNNYTIGVAEHDRSVGEDERMLYVSVDLYKHILGEDGRASTAEGFLSRLRERIGERLPQGND